MTIAAAVCVALAILGTIGSRILRHRNMDWQSSEIEIVTFLLLAVATTLLVWASVT